MMMLIIKDGIRDAQSGCCAKWL